MIRKDMESGNTYLFYFPTCKKVNKADVEEGRVTNTDDNNSKKL